MNHVVIVDDDAAIAAMTTEMLAEAGWIAHAASGADALALCQQKQPDVIVLDLLMPGLDGWAFRQCLLADERTATIPVVVVTGVDATYRDLAHMQAVAVLNKPYHYDQLLRTLEEAQQHD